MGWKAVDRIPLTQDRVKWQAVVNTVAAEWFPQNEGNFLTR